MSNPITFIYHGVHFEITSPVSGSYRVEVGGNFIGNTLTLSDALCLAKCELLQREARS